MAPNVNGEDANEIEMQQEIEIEPSTATDSDGNKSYWNKYILGSVVLASTNSILLGYDIGVMSGAVLFIKDDLKITTAQVEILIGSLNVCSLLGSLASGKTSDWIGRRYTVLLSSALFLLGALLMGFAPSFVFLMIGRVVAGIGVGYSLMIAPVYTAELSPAATRGFFSSFPEIFITFGILLGYICNYAFAGLPDHINWRIMVGIAAIPAIVIAIGVIVMPESPRWLIMQGRDEEARQVLLKTSSSEREARVRLIEMTKAAANDNSLHGRGVWRELILKPSQPIRRMMIAAVGINFFMQASGNDAVIYYSPAVFKAAGIHHKKGLVSVTIAMGIAKTCFVLVSACFSALKMSTLGICLLEAILVLSFCLSPLLIQAQTLPAEVTALQAIKRRLVDTDNLLSDWNKGDPCTSNWAGVLCSNVPGDGYLRIVELQLLNKNLSGSLAPELGQLSHMEILNFMWNKLNGSIPKEIGNIISLKVLLLNGNQLSGTLPDELGYLPNLDRIQIDQNHISGPLPKSFANLDSIKHFHMNNNSISGQIPPELSRLPNLVYFLLDSNNLSGYLPPEFSQFRKLLILQLDNNHFDGSRIPPSYGNMSTLLKLSLRNCSLQGTIPDLSNIPALGYLDLSWNKLNGPIPTNKLSNSITAIDLSENNLNGTIPANFSGFPLLQRLSLENNSLSGSIPSTIWQDFTSAARSLTLDFQNNLLSNVSGTLIPPTNVTIMLRGNPICQNLNNVDQFCGSQNGGEETTNSTGLNYCALESCPTDNFDEPVPSYLGRCFCAAPLRIGYRLKSPGFSDFLPYVDSFKEYLTSGLNLEIYQLIIDSVIWEEGPRLKMHLKLFPQFSTTNFTFNVSEIVRIRSFFTGWMIPDSDIFGPYELLDFTLLGPYASHDVSKGGKKGKTSQFVAIGLAVTFVGLVLLGCFIFVLRRRRKLQEARKQQSHYDLLNNLGTNTDLLNTNISRGSPGEIQKLPFIDFGTIQHSTNNFSSENKLGQGGFGTVYKGMLADGMEFAVKRLSIGSSQGLKEFKNEVILISKLQHKNLVRLLFCCMEKEEKLLIYEYMPNKSLDFFLFDQIKRAQLTWRIRHNIVNGIARGLLYLHEDSRLKVIHRDLKASNVLLDYEMNPKISDFGLARTFRENQGESNTNKVIGTYGYMAPEYAMDGLFSVKSDVFSFGVLLLEILSGKKNSRSYLAENAQSLLAYAWRLWCDQKVLELIDPILIDSCPMDEVLRFVHIGLLCIQEDAIDRPTMSSVVLMLGSKSMTLPHPSEPPLHIRKREITSEQSSPNPKTCSSNEVTISEVEPR